MYFYSDSPVAFTFLILCVGPLHLYLHGTSTPLFLMFCLGPVTTRDNFPPDINAYVYLKFYRRCAFKVSKICSEFSKKSAYRRMCLYAG